MRAFILFTILVSIPLSASSQFRMGWFRQADAVRNPVAHQGPIESASATQHWSDGRSDHAPSVISKSGAIVRPVRIAAPARTNVTDVPLGSLNSVKKATLAYDPGTGNLFSVLLYTGNGAVSGVSMEFSSDAGSTWLETASITSGDSIPDVSVTSAMGFFIVAGIYDSSKEVLLDRFYTSDGSPLDTSFLNPQVAFRSQGQERFSEVAMSSNLYTFNNRVYCAALSNDGHVRFIAARDTGAADLFEYGSSEFSGSHGISTTYNNSLLHQAFAYISFIDSSGVLCVDALPDTTIGVGDVGRVWRDEGRFSTSQIDGTSITALNDSVLVAYSPAANGLSRAMVFAATDPITGSVWSAETVGDTLAGSDALVATMQSGNGLGVLYRYASIPAQLRFTSRASLAAPWTSPLAVSAIEPYAGAGAIADMGSGTYGFVNISLSSPVVQGAYFSTNTLTSVGGPAAPSVTGLFALAQNYPNPFNPKTVISGQWTADSNVRLVVYDLLGREVAVLANGRYPAGRYSFTFDGRKLASGVYFYRLTAGAFSAVRNMLLVR